MDDRDALLEASGLEGRRTLTVDAAGEGTALLVEVSTIDMLDAWRRARAALGVTNRWPVLVTEPSLAASWEEAFEKGEPFSRWYYAEENPEARPSDVLARAGRINVDAIVDPHMREAPPPPDDHLEARLRNARAQTEHVCGDAPDEQLLRGLYLSGGDLALQWHLFRWELERGCDVPLGYQDWFEPPWPVALAFLPTPEPWSTYAFVHSLYGTDHDLLVAAARNWNARYGAEPVAAFGTMTELLLARGPATPDEALRLAVEHSILAIDTIGPPGIPLRWHAQALLRLDRWFLHNRP